MCIWNIDIYTYMNIKIVVITVKHAWYHRLNYSNNDKYLENSLQIIFF